MCVVRQTRTIHLVVVYVGCLSLHINGVRFSSENASNFNKMLRTHEELSDSKVNESNVAVLAHYEENEEFTADCGFTNVASKWRGYDGVVRIIESWNRQKRAPYNPDLYWWCANSSTLVTNADAGCEELPCWLTAQAGVHGFIAAQLADAIENAAEPVADIGSGTGWLLNVFKHMTTQKVWGVDASEAAIALSRRNLGDSVGLLHGYFPGAISGKHFSVLNIGFALVGPTISAPVLPSSVRNVLADLATVLMPVCIKAPSPADERCQSRFVKFVVDGDSTSATVVGPNMVFILIRA